VRASAAPGSRRNQAPPPAQAVRRGRQAGAGNRCADEVGDPATALAAPPEIGELAPGIAAAPEVGDARDRRGARVEHRSDKLAPSFPAAVKIE